MPPLPLTAGEPRVASGGAYLFVRFSPVGELLVRKAPVRFKRRLIFRWRRARVRLSRVRRRLGSRSGAGAQQRRRKYNKHSLHRALVV
jgi:hypothetical protein